MCGRYSLTSPLQAIRALFGFPEQPNLAARYNIAPTQDVASVRLGDDGARHFAWLRWGLIPFWAKDPSIGNKMINARAESIAEKPAFRAAFKRRRCLIAADGFYEWKKTPDGKQPYRIHRKDGQAFGFAGLWESWGPRDSETPIESCTIITTAANAVLAPLHHRMPVILDPENFGLWLDPATPAAELSTLLRPAPDALLTHLAVSRRVNNVANDDPSVIEPIAPAGQDDSSIQGDLLRS